MKHYVTSNYDVDVVGLYKSNILIEISIENDIHILDFSFFLIFIPHLNLINQYIPHMIKIIDDKLYNRLINIFLKPFQISKRTQNYKSYNFIYCYIYFNINN